MNLVTARQFLAELRLEGISIRTDGVKISLRPADKVNSVVRQYALYFKHELIHVLTGDYVRAALVLVLREVPSQVARWSLVHDFDARVTAAGLEDGIGRGEGTRIAYRAVADRVEAMAESESEKQAA